MLDCDDNGVVVLPTGAGKTLVIREYIRLSGHSVLLLSHVKEILVQNLECVADVAPSCDVGMYSAGLNMQLIKKITVAGIQSIYKKAHLFRRFDVVLIDECHMINDEGMYREFLDELGIPYMGLTATPYRLKQGYIYQNSKLFDSLLYEASVKELTKDGYLSRIEMEGSVDEMDTTGIALTGGDFNMKEASLRFDRQGMTQSIVKSLAGYKDRYKHWLIFCIDIEHSEHVAAALWEAGITAAAVHSKMDRDESIELFKAGEIQALANVNILTTGFDYPEIDFIVMLRPTKSPTLHVQAIGRGLRLAEGKDHCLVKDFAGNTGRLGFIDNLAPIGDAEKKGKGTGINPFSKTCPECEKINHPMVQVCPCGHKFKFDHGLRLKAHVPPRWYDVERVFYDKHFKVGSPTILKVTYICGLKKFNSWVCPEHPGYAGYSAKYWFQKRWNSSNPIPTTVQEAINNRDLIAVPKRIQVDDNAKYPKILNTIF
jgi:DNA repair protein RadD